MAIDGIGPMKIDWPEATPAAGKVAPTSAPKDDFGSALAGALSEGRGAEQTAQSLSQKFANGDPSVGIHEVMIASEKAAIAVRYAVTMKNKLLEAYRDLMNTPI
jgi:flagellar hook-basal body complex protein FliE